MSSILSKLNKKQLEAVETTEGPVLILAGAGSGKTKALTHRIAYLLEKGVSPDNILAITFTNKAAGEIKERVAKIVNTKILPIMGTFHSLCVRILRVEVEKMGYGKNFVIYDSNDQLSLIKQIMVERGIDIKKMNPNAILGRISWAKNKMIDYKSFKGKSDSNDFFNKNVASIYEDYQTRLKKANAMDFDDLIMNTVNLLKKNPKTAEKYQNLFRYILVDEYQDTNLSQYQLVKILAEKYKNLFVIGDDYQCSPPGTKIKTKDGYKKIENIKKGEKIITPAGRGSLYQDEVLKLKKFHYDGYILEIKTKKGYSLRVTPNHIIFGKLMPLLNTYFIYLMYSGAKGYRIGFTKGMRRTKNAEVTGLNVRANQERADKMWVLKTCENISDAYFWETYFSVKYGIPATVFITKGRKMTLTQKNIDRLYKLIPTRQRVEKIFQDLELFPDYPHHRPQGTIRHNTKRITVNLSYFSHKNSPKLRTARVAINSKDKEVKNKLIRNNLESHIRDGKGKTWRIERAFSNFSEAEKFAHNIAGICDVDISRRALITDKRFDFMPASHIRGGMVIPILHKEKFINDVVTAIKRIKYEGNVYDLDVKTTHTYVSDGFAVHNSIYGWRNADIRNILNFEKDYPNVKVIEMTQNYRSTKKIIEAAQHIISKNEQQKHKKLWTDNEDGTLIKITELPTEREEGQYIIDTIQKGYKRYSDFAVLYRTHAQSRSIEEAFLKSGIPYRIIGGVKFYERREIKDIISYLKFILNPEDIVSFGRIYNIPPRRIGKTSYKKITDTYRRERSITKILDESDNPAFHNLSIMLKDFIQKADKYPVTKLTKYILEKISYKEYLDPTGKSLDGQARWENIQELFTVIKKYDKEKPKEGLAKLLEEVALIQETDKMNDRENAVTLMTIHSAKGLEFPKVFMIGMEEQLFPHAKSIMNPRELEEERRLCYVGITRAQEDLHLTFCKKRNIYGLTEHTLPSRFLLELPEKLVEFKQTNDLYDEDLIAY